MVANPASPDALAERIWRREMNVLQDERVQDETGQGDVESALMRISWQKQRKREFIDLIMSEKVVGPEEYHYQQNMTRFGGGLSSGSSGYGSR
ncbi:hypothetical protein PROFUN_15074 [Planoprotostelium fungivorum]|uniref:Uncharacterized protein n=1 Tax=Planoprotostelium fungivorum TaxID=1890364 RepID=A0A2P6MTA9_9EUKA|nr:hypothetical protein PROFUN_15074 [Planoprotostelium fungivorum]